MIVSRDIDASSERAEDREQSLIHFVIIILSSLATVASWKIGCCTLRVSPWRVAPHDSRGDNSRNADYDHRNDKNRRAINSAEAHATQTECHDDGVGDPDSNRTYHSSCIVEHWCKCIAYTSRIKSPPGLQEGGNLQRGSDGQ